tara:strand:- start:16484 stop:17668 length:1185 start_codon:yes stop_codon:yes gene_type:complete
LIFSGGAMHRHSRNPWLSHKQQARFLEMSREAGFDLYGFTSANISEADRQNLTEFAQKNQSNDLHWFNRYLNLRTHPSDILPGALSVLMLGTIYRHPDMDAALENAKARISRYAAGKDYHLVLRKKAAKLADAFFLEHSSQLPDLKYRVTTDSAPVPEKILARNAGLGWQGKNTNLIHPEKGSYFFLTAVFFNADLEIPALHEPVEEKQQNEYGVHRTHRANRAKGAHGPNKSYGEYRPSVEGSSDESNTGASETDSLFRPANVDRCGSCRQCLDACPTGALEPYRIEANRCLSYWTIEAREDMPPEIAQNTKHWVFGCDICQEVCPYNRGPKGRRQVTSEPDFFPRAAIKNWIQNPEDPAHSTVWEALSISSAVKRPGQERFRRNWQSGSKPD